MKQLKIISIAILLLSGFILNASGRDSALFHDMTHRITAEVRPVYNMPTHGFYRGFNDYREAMPMAASAHLKYSFSLNPESSLGKLYPTAYQGVGIAVHSFFNHKLTGTPVILYIFQGSRIADLGRNVSLDCEWNLGASYGWKVNEVVGSRFNIYINVGLPLTWHISPQWDLSFGPEYTHFSNGDTRFPNGGANTVGVRLGVTGRMNSPAAERAPGRLMTGSEDELKSRSFAERLSYDISIYGAWRADRHMEGLHLTLVNKAFPLGGINFNPLYRLNRYFSVGASADLMIDRSADLKGVINEEVLDIEYPAILRQTACGLSLRGELTMPFFSINLGAGYNILTAADDLRGFYTTYNLKAFISEKLFLNIGYRLSSVLYSHNLMLGFGFRL